MCAASSMYLKHNHHDGGDMLHTCVAAQPKAWCSIPGGLSEEESIIVELYAQCSPNNISLLTCHLFDMPSLMNPSGSPSAHLRLFFTKLQPFTSHTKDLPPPAQPQQPIAATGLACQYRHFSGVRNKSNPQTFWPNASTTCKAI